MKNVDLTGHLQLLLDENLLLEKLRSTLANTESAAGHEIRSCAVKQVRSRPRRGKHSAVLAVQVRSDRGETIEQHYLAKLVQPRLLQMRIRVLRRRNLVKPQFGPPGFAIPEWNAILWAFPNDPSLKGMADLLSPERLLARWRARPELIGVDEKPTGAATQIAKYVPEKRCSCLQTASFANGRESRSIFAKLYHADDGQRSSGIMHAIWAAGEGLNSPLVVPEPFGYDADHAVFWQEALDGAPFSKESAIALTQAAASEIGVRLAAYHRLELDLPRRMTIAYQLDSLEDARAATVKQFQRHAARFELIVGRLKRIQATLPFQPETPVHGSFKLSHILDSARGPAFIDFDGANIGDPAEDLGRFVAHLYKFTCENKWPLERVESAAEAFIAGYNRAAKTQVPLNRINWFAAAHLLSSQVFKLMKRRLDKSVTALFDAAERLLP